ncbi:MAG TPA: DUF892 family protein [Candidatus Binataceae bacterium]|nr:DUF892 family protein [Candidatus Binataceae bacterium]
MKKSHTNNNGRQAPPARRRVANGSSRNRTPSSRRRGINPEWLSDFLRAMLAVEHGGVQLYEKALDDLMHENLRGKLEQFLAQTERHVELCEQLLAAAGVERDRPSPSAKAAEHKAEGLISTQVPRDMLDLNNVENLVLAETKDHWNWETLATLTDRIADAGLKKAAARAVREVRRQETDHLQWAQKTLSQLALESAQKTPPPDEVAAAAR